MAGFIAITSGGELSHYIAEPTSEQITMQVGEEGWARGGGGGEPSPWLS